MLSKVHEEVDEIAKQGIVYSSAWTVITKYHRVGDLKSRCLFSYKSGGWRSKVKMAAVSVSGSPCPWLVDGHLLTVLSHDLSSVPARGEVGREREREGGREGGRETEKGKEGGKEGRKEQRKNGKESFLVFWCFVHSTLITSLKFLSPNIISLGVKASTYDFWGTQFCP